MRQKHSMNACTCIGDHVAHVRLSFLHMPPTGFEESGVSDAEGLLAMMHQRYPDVSIRREGRGGEGRGGEGRGRGGEGRGWRWKHRM